MFNNMKIMFKIKSDQNWICEPTTFNYSKGVKTVNRNRNKYCKI